MAKEQPRKRNAGKYEEKGFQKRAERKLKRMSRGSLQVHCALSSSSSGHRRLRKQKRPTSCQDLKAEDPVNRDVEWGQSWEIQSWPESKFWKDSGKRIKPYDQMPPMSAREVRSATNSSLLLQWERTAKIHESRSQKTLPKGSGLSSIRAFLVELVGRKYFAGPTNLWIFQCNICNRSEWCLTGKNLWRLLHWAWWAKGGHLCTEFIHQQLDG